MNVELLDPAAAADGELPNALTTLVNRVYAVGEAGLWHEGSERLLPGEMAELIGAGQIAVARLQDQIVGSVRIRLCEDGRVGELGLLVSDFEHRGIGIGRALVEFAEDVNRSRGVEILQLQLLVPTAWEHPVKRCCSTGTAAAATSWWRAGRWSRSIRTSTAGSRPRACC